MIVKMTTAKSGLANEVAEKLYAQATAAARWDLDKANFLLRTYSLNLALSPRQDTWLRECAAKDADRRRPFGTLSDGRSWGYHAGLITFQLSEEITCDLLYAWGAVIEVTRVECAFGGHVEYVRRVTALDSGSTQRYHVEQDEDAWFVVDGWTGEALCCAADEAIIRLDCAAMNA